jgi:hypothetical protein
MRYVKASVCVIVLLVFNFCVASTQSEGDWRVGVIIVAPIVAVGIFNKNEDWSLSKKAAISAATIAGGLLGGKETERLQSLGGSIDIPVGAGVIAGGLLMFLLGSKIWDSVDDGLRCEGKVISYHTSSSSNKPRKSEYLTTAAFTTVAGTLSYLLVRSLIR